MKPKAFEIDCQAESQDNQIYQRPGSLYCTQSVHAIFLPVIAAEHSADSVNMDAVLYQNVSSSSLFFPQVMHILRLDFHSEVKSIGHYSPRRMP